MEELKPVFLEIRIRDKAKVESILKLFRLSFSKVKIEGLSFDKLDNNYLVSFNISPEYYNLIIEKLTLNNLQVMATNKEEEEIISKAKGKLRKKDTIGFDGWDTVANYGKPSSNAPIKELAERGDYIELIKIINDLSIDSSRRNEAKKYLHEATENAITFFYSNAVNFPLESEKSIKNLIELGSNRFLSAIGEKELVNRAMEMALRAVSNHEELINFLIDIANEKNIPMIYNLRALATFGKLVLQDKVKHKKNIKYAKYYLNLRWIIKVYDKVKSELNSEEKMLLRKVTSLINSYRTKV